MSGEERPVVQKGDGVLVFEDDGSLHSSLRYPAKDAFEFIKDDFTASCKTDTGFAAEPAPSVTFLPPEGLIDGGEFVGDVTQARIDAGRQEMLAADLGFGTTFARAFERASAIPSAYTGKSATPSSRDFRVRTGARKI